MPKVSGGVEALPNEFPWQAFIEITEDDHKEYHCGGVLVESGVVLTMGHCVTWVNMYIATEYNCGGSWWTVMWPSQWDTVLQG